MLQVFIKDVVMERALTAWWKSLILFSTKKNAYVQGSKLKIISSRLLAIIKEKRSPNTKMQSLDNKRTETQISQRASLN